MLAFPMSLEWKNSLETQKCKSNLERKSFTFTIPGRSFIAHYLGQFWASIASNYSWEKTTASLQSYGETENDIFSPCIPPSLPSWKGNLCSIKSDCRSLESSSQSHGGPAGFLLTSADEGKVWSPGGKRGSEKLVNIQRSSPRSSRVVHPNE